jgi:2,3-bisphosphoglycerate-independent phosphoglycerate mutase
MDRWKLGSGHLNIGAGRIVDQDIVRISKAMERGELRKNAVLIDAVKSRAIHFAGLLSDGGVHSPNRIHRTDDAAESLEREIYVHAILDGRDTPPKSAEKYRAARNIGHGRRPLLHDGSRQAVRVQRGYVLMTLGVGTETRKPVETLRRFYEQNVTDEFIEPISVVDADGSHHGRIEDGDTLIFFNFRADRMRQIVTAFKDEKFDGFNRAVVPKIQLITMNQYREDFGLPVLFRLSK